MSECTLPPYLFEDKKAGNKFVDVLVTCRSVMPEDRDHLQIYENNCSEQYYDDLARLVEQHVDGDIIQAKHGIRIYPED